MASNTKKTKTIRKWHKRNQGKSRKRALRANGSTPAFPIHLPTEDKAEGEAQA